MTINKVVMLLQFEPLHLNNPLLPSPAKQSPQNLHDLHCFNKGNDSSREFLPPCATDCSVSTKLTARGRSSPMCMMGPQLQGHSCCRPGSLQPPSTSALVPTLLPHQLVRLSRAVPQGSTPSNPFHFGFCITLIDCWHEATF